MPLSATPISLTDRRWQTRQTRWHRYTICGFGASALIAIGCLTAGLPLIAMCTLAVAAVSSLAFSTAPDAALGSWLGAWPGGWGDASDDARARWVPHETILASEAHASYCAILLGFAEVERALGDAPRLGSVLAPVIERCCRAVSLAGRIALLANPLQRYLDTHDAAAIRAALERLRARAEIASDEATVAALGHAAAARVRQLALLEQIAAQRERICARLALVHAALESFAAAIVKLQSVDEEQLALAGDSVSDELTEIGDDLEALESAFDPAIAA